MAPVDGKVSLSLCDMLNGEKKAKAVQEAEEEHSADHGVPPKKSFQPYHAQSVPKSEDLEAVAFSRQSSGEAVDVTTMMLRNIPNKYTQNSLLQEINEMGFTGTFDFFYLPMDVHNRSNVGYAFVNFLRNDDAERFRQKFSEHRFQRFQSRKISSVCTAHVQGLHENLRHFQSKYVETVADERLFEQVYLQYTSEYLKGPLYWHPDKLQGWLPDYPGTPMIKEGKYTSHVIGNLKAFSSNELAFLSMLFFGVGLYGNLQFNFYDPQWAKVDAGGFFNVSYIVESFLLPISFFMHIACYIQRQNGK